MKDIVRFGITLAIVALIASSALAWINKITAPLIEEQRRIALNNGLISVLPGSQDGVIEPIMDSESEQVLFYKGFRDQEKTDFIGYAFEALGAGYSSTIQTLVGMDTTGVILAINVLNQKETPGLGTRVQEVASGDTTPWWQNQFKGKSAGTVAVDKDGGEIEAITAATITSRAITKSITDRYVVIDQLIQEQENNQ